jgi:SpoVK/Ycf46/Vps4 family AAA+-type ATPase
MKNLYNQQTTATDYLFEGDLVDVKVLFLQRFNKIPSINYIGDIDGEKAFTTIKEKFATQIKDIHQYKWFHIKKRKFQFDTTVIVLENNCILELEADSCKLFHDGKQEQLIEELATIVNKYKERQKREPQEINLIVQNKHGLELKAMEIKRTKLNIDLFYEDSFKETDEIITKRLNQKSDKGIVLLHGLPGTGKTTYLRYLIGKIKKRVLFLSPNVASNLMNPDFIELLISNPNSVLIIEDAENIIMDRKYESSSSVSNLLNISDGLLADFLNVQLICTFNNSLAMVDSALMRKGRLIAKHEFGKLNTDKAQRLSTDLGFDTVIDKPMTIAEITNPTAKEYEMKKIEVLGFRRDEVMMN